MNDYATNTEHDAAISAAFDAYPEPVGLDAFDEAHEAEFWHWWWNEGRFQEATGPLIDALDEAAAKLATDPGSDWGPEVGERIRARQSEDGAL